LCSDDQHVAYTQGTKQVNIEHRTTIGSMINAFLARKLTEVVWINLL
jgi:hypothetical protein